MRSLTKYFLILGLAILLIGNFGCKMFENPLGPDRPDDNDNANSGKTCEKYPLGQTEEWVKSCYYALKVKVLRKTTEIGDYQPKKNHYFLILKLWIKNIGVTDADTPHVSTWHDFKITDDQGRNYRQENSRNNALTLSLENPIYYDDFLELNQKISGNMAFELPNDATGLILHFKTQYQTDSEIKIDLGI